MIPCMQDKSSKILDIKLSEKYILYGQNVMHLPYIKNYWVKNKIEQKQPFKNYFDPPHPHGRGTHAGLTELHCTILAEVL